MSRALESVWQFVKQVAVVTPIVVTFTDLVAGAVQVQGESMQPTMNPEERTSDDRVLLDRFSVWGYKYRRGDVVALRAPDTPNEVMVKRLIGLPGDWVSNPETQDVTQVPQGKCWVEGDNVTSSDSREFGAVPLALLQGRVSHILWPPQRVGRVESRPPDASRVLLKQSGF